MEMPQRLNWLAEGIDGLARCLGRVLAGADRVVFRRKAECVVAHRVDDVEPAAPAEVGDGVADRVVLEVADVGLARRVGEHLEDVRLGLRGVETGIAWVGDLPGALGIPDGLPARLDGPGSYFAGSSLTRASLGALGAPPSLTVLRADPVRWTGSHIGRMVGPNGTCSHVASRAGDDRLNEEGTWDV